MVSGHRESGGFVRRRFLVPAAALAQTDALRRRVAALETSEGAAREALAALQDELRDSELDLRDAREAVARLSS